MFFSKKKPQSISSAATGSCIGIEDVPDPVFSEKLLGDGVCILPCDSLIKSPADGVCEQVFDTLHAYSIRSDDGLEILVHIGLNTVELKGEGFSPRVSSGDRVSKGQVLCEADLELIKSKGYSIHTPIVITNSDILKTMTPLKGKVIGGETAVIEYTK